MHLERICGLKMLIPFVQVEETTREREERLKGWSTFLEGGDKGPQNNTAKPAEPSTTETEPASATEPEPASATEPEPQPKIEPQKQEEEADSTDSSMEGSDDEKAGSDNEKA